MLNRCEFIGNLGADPDTRKLQNGDDVCNLSIAVTEKWKSKDGERKERTEWVRATVFNKGLVSVCQNYLKKGSKIFISGKMQTRSWEQDGQKKYTTEIILGNFDGQIIMLDSRGDNTGGYNQDAPQQQYNQDAMDDTIPF